MHESIRRFWAFPRDFSPINKRLYYMFVAASGPNTEILQFDFFISGRLFPVLPAQGGFKKALPMSNKNEKCWQNVKW